MKAGSANRLLVVWLILSAMTIAQLVVASSDRQAALAPNVAITCGAILLALIKVRLIFRQFMEVRHSPALLRHLTDLWIGLTGALLLGCYLAA